MGTFTKSDDGKMDVPAVIHEDEEDEPSTHGEPEVRKSSMVSSIRRRIPKPSNPAAADGSKRRSLTADLGNTINRTIKGAGRTVGGGVEKVAKGLSLPSLRSNNTSPSASADELPQLPTEMCTAPTGEKEKKFLRKRNHMRIATILYDRQHKKDSPVAITTPRAAENEPDFDLSFAGDVDVQKIRNQMRMVGVLNLRANNTDWNEYVCVLSTWSFRWFIPPPMTHELDVEDLFRECVGSIPLRKIKRLQSIATEHTPSHKSMEQSTAAVKATNLFEFMVDDVTIQLCAPDIEERDRWIELIVENAAQAAFHRARSASVPPSDSKRSKSERMGSGVEAMAASHIDAVSVGPAFSPDYKPPTGDRFVAHDQTWGDVILFDLYEGECVNVWVSSGLCYRIDFDGKSKPVAKAMNRHTQLSVNMVKLDFSLDYAVKINRNAQAGGGANKLTYQDTQTAMRHKKAPTITTLWLEDDTLVPFVWLAMLALGTPLAVGGAAVSVLYVLLCGVCLGGAALSYGQRREAKVYKCKLVCHSQRQLQTTTQEPRASTLESRDSNVEMDPFAHQITEMREVFPDEQEIYLRRFLKASKFIADDAITQLRGYYEWRDALNPNRAAECLDVLKFGMVHFHGMDTEQDPVMYVNVGNFMVKNTTIRALEHFAEVIHQEVMRLNPTRGYADIVVDCKGFSMRTNVDLTMYQELIKIGSSCLPEITKRLFVINTPYAVRGVYNFCKGFLDERTLDKVRFLNSDFPKLMKFIPASELPEIYGGESKYTREPYADATDDNMCLA